MNKGPLSISAIAFALVTTLLASAGAHAGRSCEERKATPQTIEKGLTLAAQTLAALDASGNKVVFLARAGQDLTKYGVRYSHLGLAYRQGDGKGGHVWRVLHKLNQCGASTSAIYRQGLGEFFLDDLWRYEAAYVVPARDVQEQLLALIQNDELSLRMNHRPYSVVSYAWST
ncbi:MAG: DUF2145 domain-containing protein, partial [Herminiimonas sp.]|nr:DUF2145 domain-containing protein [Herminiimonas sp.]